MIVLAFRPRRAVRASVLLGFSMALGALGCATYPSGYRTISPAEFAAMPDSVRGRGIMIRLNPDVHIEMVAATDHRPAANGAPGYRFVVTPATADVRPGGGGDAADWDAPVGSGAPGLVNSGPVVACMPSFQVGGGGGYYAPGLPGTTGSWVSLPSTPQVVHDLAPLLNCDSVEDRDDCVLCRCDPPPFGAFGREYFCRNPGYEELLRRPHPHLHPGYSIIDGAFEVVVPKELIRSFGSRMPGPADEAGAPGAGLRGAAAPPPHAAFRQSYDIPRTDAIDEAAVLAGLPLDDGDRTLEALADACADVHGAVLLSLCLVADGMPDKALGVLENGIKRSGEESLWSKHGRAQDACFVLVLLGVSLGEVDAAVDAAGILLHLERPDWFFENPPALLVPGSPNSLLAVFMTRIEPQLRTRWPSFIAALERRLGGAPTVCGATRSAADTAGASTEPLRRIGDLLDRARELGLFHRAAIAAEIDALLGDALAARPDDPVVLRTAVEVELARYAGAPDRRSKAMASAEALLRVDAVQGHRARALVREAMDDLDGAESDYQRALELDSGAAGQRNELGRFYQRNRMYEQAFTLFASDPEANATDADPDYQFARTAIFARSRVDEGIQRLRRHLARVAGDDQEHLAWVHLRLGRLLALAGRQKEAVAQFEAAGQCDPLLWQAKAYAEAVKRPTRADDVVR